ncbi:MAG: RagB/SusD family nutrient uptake outer membrane protein [Sphingobacteriaceae bacterium]|nr:MAG: RagB/SusD family nutrient uptake outer membrane protein [Sphingobacteriaceae bacterium]
MKLNKKLLIAMLLSGVLGTSCMKSLDVKPQDPRIITSATVFDNPEAFKQFLAKLYATFSLTGQRGEAGLPEISAPDEGTTAFIRGYFAAQEVTTDECINAWGDGGLVEYHGHLWSDQNSYIKLMYQRLFINISYCNEFIRAVDENGSKLDAGMQGEVARYKAEARFLRAYYYMCAMDLFGNVPFVTEADKPGAFLPKQIKRAELFNYVESELKVILPEMADPGANEYGRADRAAAWAILTRLYLNAEVYTGQARYSDCINYCNEILNSGNYSLHDNYAELFLADNHKWKEEIIMPIATDGANSRSYGDMTFLIHAAVGGSMDAANVYGIASGGWGGNRMTTSFVTSKFADPSGATDSRAIFHTDGQTLTITHPNVFLEGYLCGKFKNVTSDGAIGVNSTFVDTDYPLIRLAEVYLNYAEATVRGGGGNAAEALELVNDLRERAYGDNSGNINAGQLNLNFLLDERGRELYWEGFRRTDLIRFDRFTGNALLWDWKGNVMNGTGTPSHFNLFPIPASDLSLNTNLEQNPGY